MYKIVKRVCDIILSFVMLPVLLLVVIVVGIAIKIDDRGPIFYVSNRVGKNGKKYGMLKFRSMRVNAPNIMNEDGSTYNAPDDDRVTRVGKFLRKTSIDELPQIFNIFIGNMSIIGPRPCDWESVDTFLPDEMDKMKVVPGLTGYTQAYYRNSISTREKRLYDAWYANNVSFALDLKIFFKTIKTVLKRENVYTNGTGRETQEQNTVRNKE